jgi:hypothetical protein
MWIDIRTPVFRDGGASGTVILPPGSIILSIIAHASAGGATCAFVDGKNGTVTVPVPNGAWFAYDPKHLNTKIGPSDGAIVFTGTDSYLVEYTNPGGA